MLIRHPGLRAEGAGRNKISLASSERPPRKPFGPTLEKWNHGLLLLGSSPWNLLSFFGGCGISTSEDFFFFFLLEVSPEIVKEGSDPSPPRKISGGFSFLLFVFCLCFCVKDFKGGNLPTCFCRNLGIASVCESGRRLASAWRIPLMAPRDSGMGSVPESSGRLVKDDLLTPCVRFRTLHFFGLDHF